MNLIAAAVTKAFHADGVHARYAVVGGNPTPEGISLNPEERRIVADTPICSSTWTMSSWM
jgi:hypothetical protein